jgi:hypothetical protein
MKKNKKISVGKLFTIITTLTLVCLSFSMADLFSSLITVGGFSFTNNDIIEDCTQCNGTGKKTIYITDELSD